MPFNGVFVRIEEFSEAYESRIEDFILVAKENRSKTLSMYLGGVVIENKIKLVYNPLKQEKTDFTDLRYRAEKDIETEEFEEWLASFREVHNWINDQKQRIED